MSEISSIIVFGPTGNAGQQILRRGILEGLEVTAYVRKPQKIPSHISGKLHRVIQGDVLDRKRVEDAIEGHGAVLSAIGTGWNYGETTVISEGCKNIIAGMKKHNVTKLIVVSQASLLPGHKSFFKFKNSVAQDHARQIEILKEESGSIEWIAMMPAKIKNSAYVEQDYKVEKNTTPGDSIVTAGELADFMVKVFMDKTSTECFKHTMLGISSYPKITSTRRFKVAVFATLAVVSAGLAWYYGVLPTIFREYFSEAFSNERVEF